MSGRRIYDNPNHRDYGPVRRLHVMLMQLVPDLEEIDKRYKDEEGETWDSFLSYLLGRGLTEPGAQRHTMTSVLHYT